MSILGQLFSGGFVILMIILVFYLISSVKILAEYERGVIFRLGRVLPSRRGQESFWCSRRSIGWCGCLCVSKRSRSRHKIW